MSEIKTQVNDGDVLAFLGRGCLYINNLADVDMGVLEELAGLSSRHMKETNGGF